MSKYINLFEEILDKVKVSVEVGLKPNFEMLKACFELNQVHSELSYQNF